MSATVQTANHILFVQAESSGRSILARKTEPIAPSLRLQQISNPPTEIRAPVIPEPQPGTWYIVVTCKHCQSTIILFRDLNDGKGSLGATYVVTCPHCQRRGEYEGRHYQHVSHSHADLTN